MRSRDFRVILSRNSIAHQDSGCFYPDFHAFKRLSAFWCLCPDFHSITRLVGVYVQTLMRSRDFRVCMSRQSISHQAFGCLSGLHQTFSRSCSDTLAFIGLSCVRSCSDPPAFIRLSCVLVQTFLPSSRFRAFLFRPSCLQQTFAHSCSVPLTFMRLSCVLVQTFFDVSRLCYFEHMTPPLPPIFGLNTCVWGLSLRIAPPIFVI